MRGEVLNGVERRRRWSDEQKLAIIMEVGVRGATVTRVAQRHDITRQQLYAWRHELKRKGPSLSDGTVGAAAGSVFLPIDLSTTASPEQIDPVAKPGPELIAIVLRNGRELRVPGDVGDAVLARLIQLVETA